MNTARPTQSAQQLLSPWERLGEGVSTKEKLTNLKGLGYAP